MADRSTLQIVIEAVDNASNSLKNIGEHAKGAGRALTAIGAVGAAGLGLAIKAAIDAEQQMARVDAIFGALEGTTKTVSAGFRQLTDAELASNAEFTKLNQTLAETDLAQREVRMAADALKKKFNEGKISQEQYALASEKLDLRLEQIQGSAGEGRTAIDTLKAS